MGWASAGDIFDPVAQALIDVGASDEIKTRACSALIEALQSRDWDTENESLSKFANDPSIVAAFRENGIIIECGNLDDPDSSSACVLELNHDGNHEDWRGKTWPGVGANLSEPVLDMPDRYFLVGDEDIGVGANCRECG